MKKLSILLALLPLLASCGNKQVGVAFSSLTFENVEQSLKSETIFTKVSLNFTSYGEKYSLAYVPSDFTAKLNDVTVNAVCFINGVRTSETNNEKHVYANETFTEFSHTFNEENALQAVALDVAFPESVNNEYKFYIKGTEINKSLDYTNFNL